MATQNSFFRQTLETIPEDTRIFARRQVQIMKRIRYLLESQQIIQKELARRMGKRESEVSKWLSGKHNLTLRSLAKLEAALGADIISVPENAENNSEGRKEGMGSG